MISQALSCHRQQISIAGYSAGWSENVEFDDVQAGALTRRKFVQLGAATAIAAGAWVSADAAPRTQTAHRSMMGAAFAKRDPRIAIIGTGGRGTSLLGNLLVAKAQVVA